MGVLLGSARTLVRSRLFAPCVELVFALMMRVGGSSTLPFGGHAQSRTPSPPTRRLPIQSRIPALQPKRHSGRLDSSTGSPTRPFFRPPGCFHMSCLNFRPCDLAGANISHSSLLAFREVGQLGLGSWRHSPRAVQRRITRKGPQLPRAYYTTGQGDADNFHLWALYWASPNRSNGIST
ncbi:hypothetical protein BX600DRAFT_26215 [Xylariales sp. PMI_506]|nr:hypothetical protein BX600DRAFT_26215 [Xylariales sp. PMI_506]